LENQAAEKSSAESNLKNSSKETGTAAERAEAAYRKERPAVARAKEEVVAAAEQESSRTFGGRAPGGCRVRRQNKE